VGKLFTLIALMGVVAVHDVVWKPFDMAPTCKPRVCCRTCP
jgi:hypothetical protein